MSECKEEKNIFITEEEYKDDIRNIFHKFTVDKDEKTKESFLDVNVMRQIFIALGRPLPERTLNDLEMEVIKDGLLGVPYKRFEQIYIFQFPFNPTQILKEAFDAFDVNRTGRITFEDIKKVAESLSLQFTDEELKDIILSFDTTGQAIEYKKLCDMFE